MRLIAKDLQTNSIVNVTLRNAVDDLTDPELNAVAYTHFGRTTVAGRLRRNAKGYVFARLD